MTSELTNTFLLVFAGLFPIVNPVGSAPLFLSLTRYCSEAERHRLAWRVAINGFCLLLGSLFVGSHVLEFFGITLPTVRIAGGLVLIAFGWRTLHAEGDTERTADAHEQLLGPTDAFYPLTMPLTIGPGSMSVAITLGSQRPKEFESLGHLALLGGAAVGGLLAITATVFVCYRFAERIVVMLGQTGTNVVIRLSAFILMCIGIQVLWNGYRALTGSGG